MPPGNRQIVRYCTGSHRFLFLPSSPLAHALGGRPPEVKGRRGEWGGGCGAQEVVSDFPLRTHPRLAPPRDAAGRRSSAPRPHAPPRTRICTSSGAGGGGPGGEGEGGRERGSGAGARTPASPRPAAPASRSSSLVRCGERRPACTRPSVLRVAERARECAAGGEGHLCCGGAVRRPPRLRRRSGRRGGCLFVVVFVLVAAVRASLRCWLVRGAATGSRGTALVSGAGADRGLRPRPSLTTCVVLRVCEAT